MTQTKYFFIETDGDTLADLVRGLEQLRGRKHASNIRVRDINARSVDGAQRMEISGEIEL